MSWYIRPEEIIAETRRRYPTERVIGPPKRPIAPRVTFANEYLYGVLIYIYGEGIKGQYLRHGYFDREGERYWSIEYGWVNLYGRTIDGKMLPLVMLGIPTRFVFEYKPRDFKGFKLEEVPLDFMECRERQMINLDRVMSGRDPVLIIDKYDVLGGGTPSEFIDRVIEQQSQIKKLQDAIWSYEKIINDYKTNIEMLKARNAKLQGLLRDYEDRMVKLATEVTSVQQELIRLREEILVRGAEAESLEGARRVLRDLVDGLSDMIKDVAGWLAVLKEATEIRREEVEGKKEEVKKEVEAK